MVLYEGVDLAYNVVRLTYNGISGVYNWYYQVEAHETEEKHKEAQDLEPNHYSILRFYLLE